MTLLRQISYRDSPNLDAFARLRVSQPTLLLDIKRPGSTPDNFTTTSVTGTGSVLYSADRASTALTVGSAVGTAIRQSKSRAIYQPGKSMLIFQTFIMAPGETNLRQRVGFFDTKNGVFFQLDGTTSSMNIRSYVTGSAVDNTIAQTNWNLDKLDGTGSSGITLDLSKPQIFIADLEWLGVGRVRVGFVIDGLPVYVHEFLHANTDGTSVYMSNPNLPIRWEIEATGAIVSTASLESICASVNSEGGYDITGVTASTDMGNTVNQIPGGGFEEILAVRMRSTFTEFATAFLQRATILAASSSNFLFRIVLNPTETGAGTWTNVNTNGSVMERNSTRVVTENTGIVISAGYVASANNNISIDDKPVLTFGTGLDGVTDVLSLQVRNLGGGNEDYLGSLTWREIF